MYPSGRGRSVARLPRLAGETATEASACHWACGGGPALRNYAKPCRASTSVRGSQRPGYSLHAWLRECLQPPPARASRKAQSKACGRACDRKGRQGAPLRSRQLSGALSTYSKRFIELSLRQYFHHVPQWVTWREGRACCERPSCGGRGGSGAGGEKVQPSTRPDPSLRP